MSNPSPFHWLVKAATVIGFIVLMLALKPLVKGLAVLAANALILIALVAGIYWIVKGGGGAPKPSAPRPRGEPASARDTVAEIEAELAQIKHDLGRRRPPKES